ncbi:MAG TPA: ATP-binding protein [Panacibacter sp.]|nr:ATP-binding protein [Panacibacter sp.]HNP46370.1 ATP-binding protein [Panacibacter sp.]
MIKKFFCVFFIITGVTGFGQSKETYEIRQRLSLNPEEDTNRVLIMAELSYAYSFKNSDSALFYANNAIALAQKIHFTRGALRAMYSKAAVIETNGDMPEALNIGFAALEIAQKANLLLETSMSLTLIANVFYDLNDYPRAISFYQQAVPINQLIKNQPQAAFWNWQTEVNLGTVFMLNNQFDSSFKHLQKAFIETVDDDLWHPVFLMFFGQLQFKMGKQDTGLNYLHESISLFKKNNDIYSIADACRIIASCFKQKNEIDSTIFYAKEALEKAQSINYKTSILEASKLLAEGYESKDIKQALYFHKVFDTTNDILYGSNKVKSLQKTLSAEQDRQRKIEAERIEYQNRIKQYGLLAGLLILLLIGFILYRNNRQQKRANNLLQQQKEKIESTLQELKSTQAQLIQSEKMASLGELTAGIAHEIQNPLNFVNNFSDVNKELLVELKDEAEKGNFEEVKAIASDVISNEEKINHHGKRADAIVKGMLQHSRSSTGEKEASNINKLADEYLRLSYQGMRAKDNAFNTEIITSFDETIGNINVVPQDIGRVLLNLYNNAFYAVNERQKVEGGVFKAAVSVTTKKNAPLPGTGAKIEISVADNGNGIPEKIKEKIFQPFFTTKPTGSGTGLGLSLSYDIVKAHGGEIRVETKKGEGTEFIVQLPI